MMNLSIAICILSTCCCLTVAYQGNGRPACRTEEELNIGIFRDDWDPTAYWRCLKLDEPGVLERCPDETGFMESKKKCVIWKDWQWEPPIAPLSEAESEQ